MSDNRWQRIENIFHQAVELAPEARSAFLHEACATDESLRKEVESLLAHETEDGSTFVNALGALEDSVTTFEDLSGRTIGPYRVLRRIGSGGMGVVYEACDTRLDRHVALKVLPASRLTDETARARLVREARMASKLNHPHVCTIHEVGESDGQAYIAMELVEGRTLSARLAEGALPADEVLRFGQQVADALAHAHDHGVVHRDLKSANVIITPDGRAKVLDFGLAKRLSAESPEEAATQTRGSLTAPGVVVGTLAYLAPEQLRGQPADARSDIWALGVVLYEMAAGGRPFQGTTGFDLSSAILTHAPQPLPAAVSSELGQEGKYTAAFDLAKEVERFIPTDSRLAALWPDIARSIRLETDPPGAEMYRKDYNEPETAWRLIGKSPAQLTVPRG